MLYGMLKQANILDQALAYAKENPQMAGAGIGALGGAGLGGMLGGWSGAGLGALGGGAAGYGAGSYYQGLSPMQRKGSVVEPPKPEMTDDEYNKAIAKKENQIRIRQEKDRLQKQRAKMYFDHKTKEMENELAAKIKQEEQAAVEQSKYEYDQNIAMEKELAEKIKLDEQMKAQQANSQAMAAKRMAMQRQRGMERHNQDELAIKLKGQQAMKPVSDYFANQEFLEKRKRETNPFTTRMNIQRGHESRIHPSVRELHNRKRNR